MNGKGRMIFEGGTNRF